MRAILLMGAVLLLLLTNHLIAQDQCTLRLYGRVIDEHDASALAYANLLITAPSERRIGIAADQDGRYEVTDLCPGDYRLVVSHIGCEPDTVEFTLTESRKLNLQLEHHLEELQAVEVASEASSSLERKERVTEEMKSAKAGESMADMLKQLPGVNAFKTGANVSKPMIGGFTSNRIQIINDGVQHSNQNWGDEHAPEIDPFASTNLSVIRGASAVKYGGGALGGFVLVEPKPLPRSPGIDGKWTALYATNNRMYASALMLEGNSEWLPKLSWRAEGSFRRGGNIRSPNYYQNNTGIDDQNFGWQVAWFEDNWKVSVDYSLYNSQLGIFSGAHIGNLSDLQAAIDQDQPRAIDREGFSYEIERPYQLITHELLKAEFNRYFDNSIFELNISRQFNIREEFDKERPRNRDLAVLNIPEFSLSLASYILSASYNYSKVNWEWEVGGGLLLKENSVNSFTDFIPDYRGANANLYGLVRWTKSSWVWETAARIDHTQLDVSKLIMREFNEFEHDFSAFTGSFGMIKKLSEQQELSLNLSFAERAPAINELYSDGLHHGTASLEYGDPEIDLERSYSARLDWTIKKSKWAANVQTYLQYIDDFIYLEPDGFDLTIRGAYPVFRWENTNALLRGIDLDLDYQLSEELSLKHKSSFLWAAQISDQMETNYLVSMPANRLENSLIYKMGSRATFSYLKDWRVGVTHQYVFRQRRFDPEVEIAVPPGAYQLISLNANRSVALSEKLQLRIGLTINNLLNESYRDYLNRFRYYADEMGRDLRINLELNF